MTIHNIYPFLIGVLLLASCRTTKNIQTAHVNTDSVVTRVKDSMSFIHRSEITDLRRMIEEMTSSGVTFVVDSCPERDAVLALLDSTGRANYEKIMLERKVKDLSNKVTISEKGAITAEGNIKEARFTNTKLQQELQRTEVTIEQLTKENESLKASKTVTVDTKTKDVVRKGGVPWFLFWLAVCLAAALGWVIKSRLSIAVKRLPGST